MEIGAGMRFTPIRLPWETSEQVKVKQVQAAQVAPVRKNSAIGTTDCTLGPVTTHTTAPTQRQETPQARFSAQGIR